MGMLMRHGGSVNWSNHMESCLAISAKTNIRPPRSKGNERPRKDVPECSLQP